MVLLFCGFPQNIERIELIWIAPRELIVLSCLKVFFDLLSKTKIRKSRKNSFVEQSRKDQSNLLNFDVKISITVLMVQQGTIV